MCVYMYYNRVTHRLAESAEFWLCSFVLKLEKLDATGEELQDLTFENETVGNCAEFNGCVNKSSYKASEFWNYIRDYGAISLVRNKMKFHETHED